MYLVKYILLKFNISLYFFNVGTRTSWSTYVAHVIFLSDSGALGQKSRQVCPSRKCKWQVVTLLPFSSVQREAQFPFQKHFSLTLAQIAEVFPLSLVKFPVVKWEMHSYFFISQFLKARGHVALCFAWLLTHYKCKTKIWPTMITICASSLLLFTPGSCLSTFAVVR